MIDKHKEFAEAMRSIMHDNEEKHKEKTTRHVSADLSEKRCSLQEMLEDKFDELFGPN